ncbi:MAG: HDOD domain-containing protein [Treponema sp.]|nr:HDOD domain-containing protein [Treponema sp.]
MSNVDIEDTLQDIDKDKIKTAIQLHMPIEVTSYTLPRNMEVYIHDVLNSFLEECHQEHMTEYLNFCLGELLTNSKKANTKRIYFKEKNLDINNEDDYNLGMLTFKEDTLTNIDHYLEEQKKSGLYIKFRIQQNDEFIKIEIRNNCTLTSFEKERIQEKLSTAQQYDNIEEVMTTVLDQTEGAGLGIIIIILMLSKIGLSKTNYKVISNKKETITSIDLPLNADIKADVESLARDFNDNITSIPVVKKNFDNLKTLLYKDPINPAEIVDAISHDATLSLILLKNAIAEEPESTNYYKAIELLGQQKLQSIFSENNKEIRLLDESDTENDFDFWAHSYKVAFFTYNLAKNFPCKLASPEELFLYALFHDIACVFTEYATEGQKMVIDQKALLLDMDENVVKLFYNNSVHAKSGSWLLENWGFPKRYQTAVKYHNDPNHAPEELKELIYYIYLADIIQYYQKGMVKYYQLNEAALEYFGIDSEDKLKYFIGIMEADFQ